MQRGVEVLEEVVRKSVLIEETKVQKRRRTEVEDLRVTPKRQV